MMRPIDYALRMAQYGWQASPIALRMFYMKTDSLIAVLCAQACVDGRMIGRWSMQENHVASTSGIVFW